MLIIWDPKKAGLNLKKHGVSFIEAQTVLESKYQLVLEDKNHCEDRFIVLGYSNSARLLVVVYCYREQDVIRIISARKAIPKERKIYEKRIRF
jgi:uncharacterized DUF497 family protein